MLHYKLIGYGSDCKGFCPPLPGWPRRLGIVPMHEMQLPLHTRMATATQLAAVHRQSSHLFMRIAGRPRNGPICDAQASGHPAPLPSDSRRLRGLTGDRIPVEHALSGGRNADSGALLQAARIRSFACLAYHAMARAPTMPPCVSVRCRRVPFASPRAGRAPRMTTTGIFTPFCGPLGLPTVSGRLSGRSEARPAGPPRAAAARRRSAGPDRGRSGPNVRQMRRILP